MAVHIGDGEIDVRADLSGAQADIDSGIKKSLKGAEDDFDKAGKKGGSKFGGAFTGALSGVLLGGGIQQIAGFLGDSVKDAAEKAQVGAVINNAIAQSAAESRGITKKVFDDIAGDLGKAIQIDDDDIALGLAPLLRVPDLARPSFERLSKIALDASAATGKSLDPIAVALSKIATAPDEAIGALRTLGIVVEQSTKDAVKGLVEQGDEAGALELVMSDLESRYKGAAKAAGDAASPQQKLGLFMADLREKIGGGLLSGLERVQGLIKGIASIFRGGVGDGGLSTFFGRDVFEDDPIVEKISQVRDVIISVVDTVKRVWPDIQATISEVLTAVVALISGVVQVVTTIWDNFGSQITTVVVSVFGLVRDTIANVMQVVKGIIDVVTGIISGDWSRVWEGIKDIFGGVFDQILAILRNAATIIPAILSVALEILGSVVSSALDGVLGFFAELPGKIIGFFADAGSWLLGVGEDIVNGLIEGIKGMAGKVGNALLSIVPGPLKSFANRLGIGSPSKVFAEFGRNIGQGLIVGMDSMHRPIGQAALGMAGATLAPVSSVSTSQTVTVNALGAGQDDLVEMIARRVSMRLGMAAGL